MLSKYTEKNKFGGYTWQIKLDNLFHIYILGTDNSSFVVEFKEWKWMSYKTHFTYISNNNLEMTIHEIFEKTLTFFENHKDFIWTEQQKNQKLNIVLENFENLGDISNTVKKKIEMESLLKAIYAFGSEDTIIETTTNEELEKQTFDLNAESLDNAFNKATFFLNIGDLDQAINSLEVFIKEYGNNLSVLIMLASFKILKKDKIEVQKLIVKILEIIQDNLGLISNTEIEEFDIVMENFKKM